MMHPDTQLFTRHDGVGLGVRATADLPAGTLLWVRDALDIVLVPETIPALGDALAARVERLGYRDRRGQHILCWDAGKHVNHSCDATMRGVGHDAMIAIRDVAAGAEITCDYAECNLDEPLECLCGSEACRGTIGGPLDRSVWQRWPRAVETAVARGRSLPQALLEPCVDPRIAQILRGEEPVPDLADVAIDVKE